MRLVDLRNVLWNQVEYATGQYISTQRLAEAVRMIKNHPLKAGKCNLACNWVFVTQVDFSHDFAAFNKGADNLLTSATA